MSQPKFEVASGAVNGVNKTFNVSVPYAPNTTAVFLNGLALRRDFDNGWVETNPGTGVIDLKESPILGDVVQVFFTDSAADGGLETVSSPLFGRIREIETRTGVIRGNL